MLSLAKYLAGSSYYVCGKSGAATEYNGFISNAGFIITSEGVIIFDALGTPALANALLNEIRKLTDKSIKLVIVSHYHADHIYGLQVFKELGAKIWAPIGALNYLTSTTAKNLLNTRKESLFPWVNNSTHLIKPDKIITKNTVFSLGKHKFKLNVFGKVHSDGDMSLLNITDKILYSGDVIFAGRIPFVGSNADIYKWLNVINQLLTINVDYFVPGHGAASNKIKETMQLTNKYLKFLVDKFSLAVKNMDDFAETYNKINWQEFKNLPAFNLANRRNAYAVYLYLENKQ